MHRRCTDKDDLRFPLHKQPIDNFSYPISTYGFYAFPPAILTPPLNVLCFATAVDMGLTQLHLVDRNGPGLPDATPDAVRDAYRWAVSQVPNLDHATVAAWAEDLGKAMAAYPGRIEFPRRCARRAMNAQIKAKCGTDQRLEGEIRGWLGKHPGMKSPSALAKALEKWAGLDPNAQITMERTVLFEQLSNKAERKRQADFLVAAIRHQQL